MSLSAQIREQLISSFGVELAEHVQTMTDGLLALEQGRVGDGERRSALETIFRAAHSLKGAARAVGTLAVEQLAHALEDVLTAVLGDAIEVNSGLFTACYRALDAIQSVHQAYLAGETTPPVQALQALSDLEPFRLHSKELPMEDGGEESPAAGARALEQTAEQDSVLSCGAPAPPRAEPALVALRQADLATGADETVRVSVGKLDGLMAQLSELLVTKIRAEQRLAQVRQAQASIAQWQKEWLALRGVCNRLARSRDGNGIAPGSSKASDGHDRASKDVARLVTAIGGGQERLREMNTLMSDLARQYAGDTMHLTMVIDHLEEEIKRVRMLPFSTITGSFGRMVRDLAQAAGKEAALTVAGGDTELDKRVLEQIKDPLIHLLRNAVDHGIELPEKRIAAGKPRSGAITLTARQSGKDVILSVADDGAGLDLAAIRQAVAAHGAAEAQTWDEAELVEAIFNAGVTTSPIVTDLSGRGMGLDVVRRNVEALHGRTQVEWQPGAGATFILTLPLALTSSRGLLVRVSGEQFAIPLNAIERISTVGPDEVSSLEGHDTPRYNGRPITLVRLDDVLGLPRSAAQDGQPGVPVVILAAAERRMAFAVDELAGEQEVVIKDLGRQLARVGGIAGATLMGSGEVVLILNAADLIKLAIRGERRAIFESPAERQAAAMPAPARRRILIVDDSITTRTLEKNILEAAGYAIQLATDGQEALSAIAAGGLPDLVISDVAMPRMNGIELTRRLKGETQTAGLPVILVTSLDSPEDKARGIEVGADAYIVKSGFDQDNLLETIEQLV
jgi:two-component system chemotaxis sensor kinase CheA